MFSHFRKFMRLWNKYIAIFLLFLSSIAFAIPVRRGNAVYTQPDGSTFTVTIKGDEWGRIRTTDDGCAIVKDTDGWWCYAIYDSEGKMKSTGHHVGDAPAEIKSASRNIPYATIAENAARKRKIGQEKALKTLEVIRNQVVQTKSGNASIQKRELILLVQFDDVKFTYTRQDFVNLLTQSGYKGTGSVKDYYKDQFGDGWDFIFDVSEIITLPKKSAYYGANDAAGNDSRAEYMVAEACSLADKKIDFSLYDQDNDGWVDNVYVFYAGKSEAEHHTEKDFIWPHQYYIYSGTAKIYLELDGKKIDRYACSEEISGEKSFTGIGTFCHEYGHTFGLLDLYDVDDNQKDGWAAGVWRSTSLMDGGSYNNDAATPPYFNCIEREMLGLSEPIVLKRDTNYELEPIHKNGKYYRLDTDTDGEYYLFECRSNDKWDKYIGGKGMLVYHIDKNFEIIDNERLTNVWNSNMVNSLLIHQCADLIEADGRNDEIKDWSDLYGDISGIFFPRSNVTSIGTDGTPELKFWNGNSSNLVITSIRFRDDTISFSVKDKSEVHKVPSVADVSYMSFPDAAVISFVSGNTELTGAKPVVEWRELDGGKEYSVIYPEADRNGRYTCKLEGLKSGNVAYEVLIWFEKDGSSGSSYRLPFITKRKPAIDWPYLAITDNQVNPSEGLILHIVNTADAAEIEWFYEGVSISPEMDLRYRPTKSGTLKAVVTWQDGSSDIIVKELNVEQQ